MSEQGRPGRGWANNKSDRSHSRNRLSFCEHSTPLRHVATVRPYLRAVLTLAFKNLPHTLSLLLKLEHKVLICSFRIELSVHSYNAAMLRSPCRAGYNMCTTNLPLQQPERSAPSPPRSNTDLCDGGQDGRRTGGTEGWRASTAHTALTVVSPTSKWQLPPVLRSKTTCYGLHSWTA